MPYPLALGLTLLIEVSLLVAAMQRLNPPPSGPSVRWVLAVGIAANLTTHGTLWATFPVLAPPMYWLALLLAEAAVFTLEGIAFWQLGLLDLRRAVMLSFLLNVVTTALGLAAHAAQ